MRKITKFYRETTKFILSEAKDLVGVTLILLMGFSLSVEARDSEIPWNGGEGHGLAAETQDPSTGSEGHGGNVVVCRNKDKVIHSIKLLDFYEAVILRDIHHSLGSGELSVSRKVNLALNRLKRLDPSRAEKYQKRADAFFANARMIPEVLLPATNDWGHVPLGAECKVEQLIVQKPPVFPQDKFYTISRDLWDRLDKDHQAGAVVHEVVYEDAISKGHKNSINARYFTSLITSKIIEFMTKQEYQGLLELIGMDDDTSDDRPPFWLQDPIKLQACVGVPLFESIGRYAHDPDLDPLTFSKIGGPYWLNMGFGGNLSGTPMMSNLGESSFLVSVSDGFISVNATLLITVNDCGTDEKPQWVESSLELGVQIERQHFVLDLRKYVKNAVSQELFFWAESLPQWMSLSDNGILSGTPQRQDVGSYRIPWISVQAVVSGAIGPPDTGDIAQAVGEVLPGLPDPPAWLQDPVMLPDAVANQLYAQDVSKFVSNPSGMELYFVKKSGPGWVQLTSSGILVGTPTYADMGYEKVVVEIHAEGLIFGEAATIRFVVCKGK